MKIELVDRAGARLHTAEEAVLNPLAPPRVIVSDGRFFAWDRPIPGLRDEDGHATVIGHAYREVSPFVLPPIADTSRARKGFA